jgi:hypothetical protein
MSGVKTTTFPLQKKPRKVREKKEKKAEDAATESTPDGVKMKDDKNGGKEPKGRKPKKPKPPMHFTATSIPTAVNVLDGLDPKIFNEVSAICSSSKFRFWFQVLIYVRSLSY